MHKSLRKLYFLRILTLCVCWLAIAFGLLATFMTLMPLIDPAAVVTDFGATPSSSLEEVLDDPIGLAIVGYSMLCKFLLVMFVVEFSSVFHTLYPGTLKYGPLRTFIYFYIPFLYWIL